MPIIDRKIINRNIDYDGLNRDDLFSLIDRWKFLLTAKYNAKKGQILALGIMSVNPNHVACMFAAAELGMKLLMVTKPIARETIHATKMGIFGPVDITVAEDYLRHEDYHMEMFERYSHHICWESEIDSIGKIVDLRVGEKISENDIFLFASTSGTTGESKPAYYTHGDLYQIIMRNITVFAYKPTDIIQHTVNMHHASSIMHSLLPALVSVNTHYYGYITPFDIGMKNMSPEYFIEEMWYKRGVNRILLNTDPWFLKLSDEFIVDRPLIITVCTGTTATEEHYKFCRDNPVELIFHYGAVDVGGPILVDHIKYDSIYEPNKLGAMADDFYRLRIEDCPKVQCDLWQGDKFLSDRILERDGLFYHEGREAPTEMENLIREQLGDFTIIDKTLVLWDQQELLDFKSNTGNLNYYFDKIVCLNKEKFIVDTKISIEQLRAYLE